jgi:prevent-host-death family protein
MPRHSTVEAKNNLSALIDRALAGEEVVITRHGTPVVRLAPVLPVVGRRSTAEMLDWLAARRARIGSPPPEEDAATTVRRMRDEGP